MTATHGPEGWFFEGRQYVVTKFNGMTHHASEGWEVVDVTAGSTPEQVLEAFYDDRQDRLTFWAVERLLPFALV